MIDLLANAALGAVCLLLGWTLQRQFVVSSAASAGLDHLALVPQWKFFAQAKIDGNAEFFDDLHVLARIASETGEPNDWVELLYYGERPWWHTLWNPHRYSRSLIAEHALMLTLTEDEPDHAASPSALTYLTVLRFVLDRTVLGPGEMLQFAIATTSGRVRRELRIRFLSSWHCP